MEQKRILWVVAGVGLFLVIVIGAALLMYTPPQSTSTKINSSALSDTWIVPQQQNTTKDLTVISESANVYAESITTIDLNTLGNTQPLVPLVEAAPVAAVKPEVVVSRPNTASRPAAPKATPRPPAYSVEYWVQAGSYTDRIRADEAREQLTSKNYTSEIFTKTIDGVLRYRVRVGPYLKKVEAEDALLTIKNDTGFEASYLTSVKIPK
ncbi:MAG: SPOR domain-containing protein [Treponemataceae bacterium]